MGTNRVLKLTDQGEIQFFEDKANGTNKVTLKGPASTADVTLVLPSSDGDASQFLQTDGSGNLSFANGSSTLDSAYTAGQTITVDVATIVISSGSIGDDVVRISNSNEGDYEALGITKSAAGDGHALQASFTGASGAASAANFSITGTSTGPVIALSMVSANAGPVIDITNNGTGKDIDGHGSSWFVYKDGTAKIRAVAGASRGAASAYAVGSMIWNTTTNMINISDGSTNWYDAAGNIV